MALPIIGDIISAVKDLVSEVVVDKDKKNELNVRLQELEDAADKRLHEEMLAQIEVNKAEASNQNVFVAGWRPFIGWTSGVGLAWTFVVGPFVEFVARLFGWAGTMPVIDTSQLMVLVTGMLGFGIQRSYDERQKTKYGVPTLEGIEKAPQEVPAEPKPKRFLGIKLPEKAPWA